VTDMRTQHRYRIDMALAAILTIATNSTFAADAGGTSRYALHGAGTLQVDAPAQRGGSLRLRATLSPASLQTATPALLASGRFALSATLGPDKPGICYSDTIFRDDFDADGF